MGGKVSQPLNIKKNPSGDNEATKDDNKKKEETSQPVKPGLGRQGTMRQGTKPAKTDAAKPGVRPQKTQKDPKPEGENKPVVRAGTGNGKPKPNDKNVKPAPEKPKGMGTGSTKPISSKPGKPTNGAPKVQKEEDKITENLKTDQTNPDKQKEMEMVDNNHPSNTLPVQPAENTGIN
jgi:hypothetical protein